MVVSRTNHLWENRKVLFNLEEQVITKFLVVKVIINIRNQTSTNSTDLPKMGADRHSCPMSGAFTQEFLFCFSWGQSSSKRINEI